MGPVSTTNIPQASDCKPGVEAVGFKIIVAVEPVQKKTAGGIILPDEARDKERLVQVRGRIVSVGSVAFDYARFPEGTKPKVGDAVMFSKLAGYMFDGIDGKEFRIIHDTDVTAILVEDAPLPDIAQLSNNLTAVSIQGSAAETVAAAEQLRAARALIEAKYGVAA